MVYSANFSINTSKILPGGGALSSKKTLLSEERNDYKYRCFDDASHEQGSVSLDTRAASPLHLSLTIP